MVEHARNRFYRAFPKRKGIWTQRTSSRWVGPQLGTSYATTRDDGSTRDATMGSRTRTNGTWRTGRVGTTRGSLWPRPWFWPWTWLWRI